MKKIYTIALFIVFQSGFAQLDIFDIAREGTIEQLNVLIDINKDTINSINKRGDSPLVLATYHGNNDVALYLAKHIENIDIQSKNGTPIIAAVYTQNLYLTEQLLILGANIEAKDSAGKTPIMYAIISKDIDMIKLLLSFKARTDIKDKNNYAVIDYAKQTSNEDIINLIRIN